MTTTINRTPTDTERETEIAKARADVMRRAEVQGVKPFNSLKDFAGDPELTADFDVDKFLRQVRDDRAQAGAIVQTLCQRRRNHPRR